MVVLKLKYGKIYYPWFVNFSFARCTQSYLLSSNKHDKNILLLIYMCYNVKLYWCHPDNSLTYCLEMEFSSHLTLKANPEIRDAMRNPFLWNKWMIVCIMVELNEIWPYGLETFEDEFHTRTPKLFNPNAVFIGCDVLIGCFSSTKFLLKV